MLPCFSCCSSWLQFQYPMPEFSRGLPAPRGTLLGLMLYTEWYGLALAETDPMSRGVMLLTPPMLVGPGVLKPCPLLPKLRLSLAKPGFGLGAKPVPGLKTGPGAGLKGGSFRCTPCKQCEPFRPARGTRNVTTAVLPKPVLALFQWQ